MRIHLSRSTGGHQAAYTLVEMMVAGTVFSLVIAAMVTANYVGMRSYQMVTSKAGMSDSSRQILNQMPYDIQSAKMWYLGTNSGTNFSITLDGRTQVGPAIKLFSTTNLSQPYVVYYFDTSQSNNGQLCRYCDTNFTSVILASNLISDMNFRGETYAGIASTNDGISRAYRSVIHTTLSFCQFQYPLTSVGTNGLYEYYVLNFKATPHLPE